MSTQHLPADNHIIGLVGHAGAGKDTAAEYLVEHFGFCAVSFAAPLKNMLEALFEDAGVDHAWLHEPHLKGELIPGLGFSARHLMQTLGTEWGRQLHGPDWWVKLTAARLGLHNLPHSAPVHDRLVLTDVRFPNEAAWVNHLGGRCIRLHREQATPVRPHESEQHIDALPVALEVSNNGRTVHEFHDVLRATMDLFGIAPRNEFTSPGWPWPPQGFLPQ